MCNNTSLGFIVSHYQLWYEKNDLILWKLNTIQMKMLNDIPCNVNWIQTLYDFDVLGFLIIKTFLLVFHPFFQLLHHPPSTFPIYNNSMQWP
jgi:hypothetical protein